MDCCDRGWLGRPSLLPRSRYSRRRFVRLSLRRGIVQEVSNPKVSVCIPAFNQARFLPAAVESVLAQTWANLEILIVDDGSSDGTLEIAHACAATYPHRITVLTHPGHRNLGPSATVNLGLRKSTGTYCSLIGSDDIFYPHKTEQQVRYLERHPEVDAVYSPAQCIDTEGRVMAQRLGGKLAPGEAGVEKLIRANRIPDMTVLFRRSCRERIGPHNDNLVYGDWEFWIRVWAQTKMAFSDKPLVNYRIHHSNISIGNPPEVDFARALQVMESLLENQQDVELLKTSRIRALINFQCARYLFCTGQTQKALERLRSGFETYPRIEDDPSLFVLWMTDVYLPHVSAQELYPWLSDNIPTWVNQRFRLKVNKKFQAVAAACAARANYQSERFSDAKQMTRKAFSADPLLVRDPQLLGIMAKTMFGTSVLKRAKSAKRRIRATMR